MYLMIGTYKIVDLNMVNTLNELKALVEETGIVSEEIIKIKKID